LTSGDKKITLIDGGSASSGNIIQILLNLADLKTPYILNPVKCMIYHLIETLIISNQITQIQKSVVETNLMIALSKTLRLTSFDIEVVYSLFTAWSTSLLSHSSPLSNKSNHSSETQEGSDIPIPDLLIWIFEKCRSNSMVLKVVQFMGNLVFTNKLKSISGIVEESNMISNPSSSVYSRKLFLIASSEKSVNLLLSILTQYGTRLDIKNTNRFSAGMLEETQEFYIVYTCFVTLSLILNQAEQTISIVKQSSYLPQLLEICSNTLSINQLSYDSDTGERIHSNPKFELTNLSRLAYTIQTALS
jgi:hypothetical protein